MPNVATICLECLVEFHGALGNVPVDGQRKEDLLRNSLTNKPWNILETETSVILGMSHKAASPSTQRFQA